MFTTIFFFALAQVVLVAAIKYGISATSREPRLAGRLAAVTELTHRPTRIEVGRKEITRTRSEIEAVQKRLSRARQRLADLIPMTESASSATAFGVLSFILYEGEAAVALLLNLAARLGDLPDAVVAFLSPLLAAALFAALHVILGAVISIGAHHRPQRVVVRAKIGAAVAGSAVLVAAWTVLSGRSFSDPQLIEVFASFGLLMLALLLSVAGALSALVVTTLRDERSLEQRVNALEALKTALERHLDAVQRDVQQQDGHTQFSTASAGVVAGLILVCLAAPGFAQDRRPSPIESLPSAAPANAAAIASQKSFLMVPDSCEPLIDVSPSLNRVARSEALEQFAGQLELLVRTFNCSILRFSTFSGEPLFNSVREVAIPSVPDAVCEVATGLRPSGATARAVELLYPTVNAAHRERAVQVCLESARKQQEAADTNRRATLNHAAKLLLSISTTKHVGSCTALTTAVRRSLQRSQHVIVLTDGVNTCNAADSRSDPGKSQSLTFLLLPSNVPDPSRVGYATAQRISADFPHARILYFGELTASVWKRLGAR